MAERRSEPIFVSTGHGICTDCEQRNHSLRMHLHALRNPKPIEPGEYLLGGGWTLEISTRYPEEESYWAHLTEADGSGLSGADDENTSAALAVLDVILVADGEGATFPEPVAELLADFASRAAREIALSLAAPTPTESEAPHA